MSAARAGRLSSPDRHAQRQSQQQRAREGLVKLLSAKLEFAPLDPKSVAAATTPSPTPLLSDENTRFKVVAVVGLQGSGKSFVASAIASQLPSQFAALRTFPFPVQSTTQFMAMAQETRGVDMRVVSSPARTHRVVILDVQALMSSAILQRRQPIQAGAAPLPPPPDWTSHEQYLHLQTLQLLVFVLLVSHHVFVVQDGGGDAVYDAYLWELLGQAQSLKHRLPLGVSQMGAVLARADTGRVSLVLNRIRLDAVSFRTKALASALLGMAMRSTEDTEEEERKRQEENAAAAAAAAAAKPIPPTPMQELIAALSNDGDGVDMHGYPTYWRSDPVHAPQILSDWDSPRRPSSGRAQQVNREAEVRRKAMMEESVAQRNEPAVTFVEGGGYFCSPEKSDGAREQGEVICLPDFFQCATTAGASSLGIVPLPGSNGGAAQLPDDAMQQESEAVTVVGGQVRRSARPRPLRGGSRSLSSQSFDEAPTDVASPSAIRPEQPPHRLYDDAFMDQGSKGESEHWSTQNDSSGDDFANHDGHGNGVVNRLCSSAVQSTTANAQQVYSNYSGARTFQSAIGILRDQVYQQLCSPFEVRAQKGRAPPHALTERDWLRLAAFAWQRVTSIDFCDEYRELTGAAPPPEPLSVSNT